MFVTAVCVLFLLIRRQYCSIISVFTKTVACSRLSISGVSVRTVEKASGTGTGYHFNRRLGSKVIGKYSLKNMPFWRLTKEGWSLLEKSNAISVRYSRKKSCLFSNDLFFFWLAGNNRKFFKTEMCCKRQLYSGRGGEFELGPVQTPNFSWAEPNTLN